MTTARREVDSIKAFVLLTLEERAKPLTFTPTTDSDEDTMALLHALGELSAERAIASVVCVGGELGWVRVRGEG